MSALKPFRHRLLEENHLVRHSIQRIDPKSHLHFYLDQSGSDVEISQKGIVPLCTPHPPYQTRQWPAINCSCLVNPFWIVQIIQRLTRLGHGSLSQAVCKVTQWSNGEHGEVSSRISSEFKKKRLLKCFHRYKGRVMLIENTASLWGTTARWLQFHCHWIDLDSTTESILILKNSPGSSGFLGLWDTLWKKFRMRSPWSFNPCISNCLDTCFICLVFLTLLFQGLHTDEWALWEGEKSVLQSYVWRRIKLGAGRCYPKNTFCIFSQIFSVPNGAGSPCIPLQSIWPPGECHKPGFSWSLNIFQSRKHSVITNTRRMPQTRF